MSKYEKIIRRALWQTVFFLFIVIASLLFVFISAIEFKGHFLKISLLCSSAAMTIAALIAQNRHSHFSSLLTPNTFVEDEFVTVLLKYRKYQTACNWVLMLLAVLGVLVATYGSLVS